MLTSNARIQINTISDDKWDIDSYRKEDEELSERFEAYCAEFNYDIGLAERVILILQRPIYYSWPEYIVTINKLAHMISENDDIHRVIVHFRWAGECPLLHKIVLQTYLHPTSVNLHKTIKKFEYLFESTANLYRQSLMEFFEKEDTKIQMKRLRRLNLSD